jgi:hypothetical protein
MNYESFYESLENSEGAFCIAIGNEERNDFEVEDTMERKYEEGFIDGMRHAFTLLTGNLPEGWPSDEIEKHARKLIKESIKGNA